MSSIDRFKEYIIALPRRESKKKELENIWPDSAFDSAFVESLQKAEAVRQHELAKQLAENELAMRQLHQNRGLLNQQAALNQPFMTAAQTAGFATSSINAAFATSIQGIKASTMVVDDPLQELDKLKQEWPTEAPNPTGVRREMRVSLAGGKSVSHNTKELDRVRVALNEGWVVDDIEIAQGSRNTGFASFSIALKAPAVTSKATLDAARDQSCINCGKSDGTVVACHYQGIRANDFGRGKGEKAYDLMVADLCSTCHKEFDSYEGSAFDDPFMRKIDLSERFMYCILMTQLRRVRQGVLKFSDKKANE